MRFKTNIEIVTGFLASGKTIFINALLEQTLVEGERVVIIQYEDGESSIDEEFQDDNQIIIKKMDVLNQSNCETLKQIIEFSKPHRIIIEHNGTTKLNDLLRIIDKKELKAMCKVTSIFHMADAATFKMYIENMGNILLDSIYNSHLIILTNTEKMPKDKLKDALTLLENLNSEAYILQVDDIEKLSSVLEDANILFSGQAKTINIFLKNLLSN